MCEDMKLRFVHDEQEQMIHGAPTMPNIPTTLLKQAEDLSPALAPTK